MVCSSRGKAGALPARCSLTVSLLLLGSIEVTGYPCAVRSCTSAEVATHRLCANSVYTIPAVPALSEFVLRTSAGAMQDVETASGAERRRCWKSTARTLGSRAGMPRDAQRVFRTRKM